MDLMSVQTVVQMLSGAIPPEVSIAVADRFRFVYYQPGRSIDLKIKPGDEVREGTLTRLALKKRMRLSRYLEKSPFGVSYFATSTPIVNGDRVEGCFTLIYPPFSQPSAGRRPFLIGKADGRWVPVPFSDIYLVEADGGKTLLHTASGKYINKYSLAQLESMLPPDQFIRCHRAYIVNVNAIAEIHPDFHSTFVLVLKDGLRTRVSVSQTYASRFRHYMGF